VLVGIRRSSGLTTTSATPSLHAPFGHTPRLRGTDDRDTGLGIELEHSARRVQLVVLGQHPIEAHAVGTGLLVEFGCLFPVGCFADEFPAPSLPECL
jgi:hypothetical protein